MTALALLLAIGCAGPSSGSIAIDVSGEDAAEVGFPAEEVADGWAIAFDRVLVSLDDVSVAARDGDDARLALDPVVVALHDGPVEAWRADGVGSRRWDSVGYRIVPATLDARRIGADDADVERMIASGWSVLVEGRATRGGDEVEFSIGAPITIVASECRSGDGTDGIVIGARATTATEITIHLDHLFFDTFTDDASMRFDAWAAVAGDDRRVTLDELASQPLADLRGPDGSPLRDEAGELLFYDPGSLPLETPDLAAFVRHQIATVAHLNGEGHCRYAIE